MQVLHYMLSQPELMVKAWRARIYSYSSATLLKLASASLKDWMQGDERRATDLQKLRNRCGLFPILGDAVVHFVQMKTQPFPQAMLSKRHFMSYEPYKRAMIAIFMIRLVLQIPANKQWKNYSVQDYKWNVRMFRNWMKHDAAIIRSAPRFTALPNDFTSPPHRRRRTDSPSVSQSPSDAPITVFDVEDESSEDSADDK